MKRTVMTSVLGFMQNAYMQLHWRITILKSLFTCDYRESKLVV